jgi:PAS domain-containing protein
VFCNALDVWGLQEGTGEGFFALIHPDDRQQVLQAAAGAMAGEQPYAQEYRVICPTALCAGSIVRGESIWMRPGKGVRMIGVSVDITERKQIEAERDRLLKREQSARLEAESERKRLYDILMQFPAMIGIVKGSDLVYEFANPTYLQVAGRTLDIIGKPLRQVFPELEGQIYFDVLEQVYRREKHLFGRSHLLTGIATAMGCWKRHFSTVSFRLGGMLREPFRVC